MTKVLFFVLLTIWCLFCQFSQANEQCPAGFQCSKSMKASSTGSNNEYELILTLCPPGTASELGQYGCTPCQPGYYANASGTASCSACPAGSMCADAAKSPAPCPLGTYASCTSQTCCSSCALGTYTPRVGSIHCINCPPGVQCPKSPTIVCGGDLLSPKHQAVLTEFTGRKNLKWKLLYKATRDGFGAADFHRLCDGHAQTMTIIQSKQGYLFGGYANFAWISSDAFTNDPRAFIFTLTNPHSILPTRYLIKGGKEHTAYYNGPLHGPVFGAGNDIYVVDKSNVTDCPINFPHSYMDTTGKGDTTFTGNYIYRTNEIEVYKLLD